MTVALEALATEEQNRATADIDQLTPLDIVRRILDAAPAHLNPGGGMLCEIGAGREILEAEYPHLDFFWLDTEESDGEVFWLSAESLGVEDRHQLVELLDGYLAREQPEAGYIELCRLFMRQRQETCFHESETWARRYVLEGTAEALWFSDDTAEDDFSPDDLNDELDEIIPY